MKNILIFLLCIIAGTVYSQTKLNPNLNKFVGVWRWTSGNDTMEIALQKQTATIPLTGTSSEVLVGWHKYVKNGITIQSSMRYLGRDVNLDFNDQSQDLKITLEGTSKGNDGIFFYSFWDLSSHKNMSLYFELLPNSTTQAFWKLVSNSALPKNLTLTKQ